MDIFAKLYVTYFILGISGLLLALGMAEKQYKPIFDGIMTIGVYMPAVAAIITAIIHVWSL